MFYKGRSFNWGDRVKVHLNLHNNKFSIVAIDGIFKNLVVAHIDMFEMSNCTFIVSESGRQRVLNKKVKNVHAFIVGNINNLNPNNVIEEDKYIRYNPYETEFWSVNDIRIDSTDNIICIDKKVYKVRVN